MAGDLADDRPLAGTLPLEVLILESVGRLERMGSTWSPRRLALRLQLALRAGFSQLRNSPQMPMNKFWTIALLLLAVLVGVGFTVESVETIPDNAKIVVFPSRKAWLPDAKFVAQRLATEYNDPSTAMQTA